MKHETKLRILSLTLPCLLTVFFSAIYSLGTWSSFQLVTVNILCTAFIAIELAQAFTEPINTWKVCGFIGSGAISGITTAINLLNDMQSQAFTLNHLSFWSWMWTGLLAICVIALVVVLIRIFCWNQEQWEEIRKWCQDYKKEQMEAWRTFGILKKAYRHELLKRKGEAKLNKQKDQAAKDIIIRNRKHEQRMQRLNDWKKYWDNIIVSVSKYTKFVGAFVASIMMALLFLLIPYSEKLQSIVFNWFDAVDKLAQKINVFTLSVGVEKGKGTFLQAFANYIIFYISLIVAIWGIQFLCQYIFKVLTRNEQTEKEQNSTEKKSFLEEYDTAIAVLTVFTALLFAFRTSGSFIWKLANEWSALLIVIFLILILFASVEIVRLIVEQIGQKNSLLKRVVQLIFVAILEFFSGLLLGVIINFKIEKVISSLLTVIFPQEELSFSNRIQKKFNEMFNKELDDDGNNDDGNLASPYFSKKHIWRRYHKK